MKKLVYILYFVKKKRYMYGSEERGFSQAKQIERIHMLFCKQLLGVRTRTQNVHVFINGELGRVQIIIQEEYVYHY